MLSRKTHFVLGCCLFTLAADAVLASQNKTTDMNVELESGYGYDTNLGIEELDRASSNSDEALLLGAKVDGSWRALSALTLTGGYQLKSRDYREMDAFDILTHLIQGGVRYDLDGYSLGGTFHYAEARLDGDDFVQIRQPSLSVGKLVNDQWYWRVALSEQRKSFAALPHRDADNQSIGGDLYYFHEPDNYLSLSVATMDEKAATEAFDYQGWRMRVQWSREFDWQQLKPALQVSWQHGRRDYGEQGATAPGAGNELPIFADLSGATTTPGASRDDRIDNLNLALELPLNQLFSVVGQVQYSDHQSSVATWSYDKTLFALSAKMRF
ncbi:MAG: surface lipoprotein assembly modifier [Porticoccaceae bacterium]